MYKNITSKHGYMNLSEQIIEKFKDEIDWKELSFCKKLTEGFIEKYQDRVDWVYISSCQVLSEPFIQKFQKESCMNLYAYSLLIATKHLQDLNDS